ncbi:MAG: CheR family methyltransferase [Bacteroidia bacterium]
MADIDNTKIEENNLYVIGVGASAGGLEAISDLLRNSNDIKNACFVICQHLSPTYKSMLVDLLKRETKFDVKEAQNNIELKSGTVYITPPDSDIQILKNFIILTRANVLGPKPSINFFFESLALDKKSKAIAIILSGTGSDGSNALKEIKENGGFVIVQDPEMAKYSGMPNAAIDTGYVDIVTGTEHMAAEIIDHINSPNIPEFVRDLPKPEKEKTIDRIFGLLSHRTGTDFANYKSSTILRRLEKRMIEKKVNSIEAYLNYIDNNAEEIDELFNSILIGVTSFFRDKSSFEALKNVLEKIIENNKKEKNIRIWVAGCATGEEAYSIAIMLQEALAEQISNYNIQIFATDIDQIALNIARTGFYSANKVEGCPENILTKYFIKRDNGYVINKITRSFVLFSKHDLTSNPPFLKLDLITCRNVLIYFNVTLQQQILPIFHYSLNKDGYLFLGRSETIGQFTDLFSTVNAKEKIYQRKIGSAIHSIKISAFKTIRQNPYKKEILSTRKDYSIQEIVKETIYNQFDYPYVIINDTFDILEIAGDVKEFLSLPQGVITSNIVKLSHKDLQIELRSLLTQSIKTNKSNKSGLIKINIDGKDKLVKIGVKPLLFNNSSNNLYMVYFESLDMEDKYLMVKSINNKDDYENLRIIELEQELAATKEHLQSFVEELETANEELQSTNEELQSTNEELQSSNEELETSNEELQSTNEEIQVAYAELKKVNEELESKEAALVRLNSDISALLNNSLQSFILVSEDYKILEFNMTASELFFKLTNNRIEKNSSIINYIDPNYLVSFRENFNEALRKKQIIDSAEFRSHDNKVYFLKYSFVPVQNTIKNTYNSVVISVLDISEEKYTDQKLFEKESLLNTIYEVTTVGICITDENGLFFDMNNNYLKIYGYEKRELIGKSFTIVVEDDYKNEAQKLHDEFIQNGHEIPKLWKVKCKNGKIIEIFVNAKLIVMQGKKYKVTAVIDIKHIKELLNTN